MRIHLLTAACAAALFATPALAQEAPPTDPVGTPDTAMTPAPADETVPPAEDTTASEAVATADAVQQAEAQTADAASNTIVDVLRSEGQFTTLVSALEATGLDSTLEADDSISILAPTDAAFAALPAGELERLMQEANREELTELLLYHVINADVRAEQIEGRRGPVETGAGAQILLDGSGAQILADNATVTQADLRGSNGGVFVIDQVLNPEQSLAGQGDVEADEAAADAAQAGVADQPAAEQSDSMPTTPPTDTAEDSDVTSEEDAPTPQ